MIKHFSFYDPSYKINTTILFNNTKILFNIIEKNKVLSKYQKNLYYNEIITRIEKEIKHNKKKEFINKLILLITPYRTRSYNKKTNNIWDK